MAYKTIAVLPGDVLEKEANVATGQTITPGHLVNLDSSGDLIVHAGAGKTAQKAFALEADIVGGDLTATYAAASRAKYGIFQPGAEVYAWQAVDTTVAIGDWLESAGNGQLRPVTASVLPSGVVDDPTIRNSVVGRALAAQDLTLSGLAATRLLIEVA